MGHLVKKSPSRKPADKGVSVMPCAHCRSTISPIKHGVVYFNVGLVRRMLVKDELVDEALSDEESRDLFAVCSMTSYIGQAEQNRKKPRYRGVSAGVELDANAWGQAEVPFCDSKCFRGWLNALVDHLESESHIDPKHPQITHCSTTLGDYRTRLYSPIKYGGKIDFNVDRMSIALIFGRRNRRFSSESPEAFSRRLADTDLHFLIDWRDDLTHLSLDGTSITDLALIEIGKCKQLQKLSLQSTNIIGKGLSRIGGLGHLEYLDLSRTPLRSSHLDSLARLPKLATLNLEGTQVSESAIKRLKQTRLKLNVKT